MSNESKPVATIPARTIEPSYPSPASYSFEQIQRMAVAFAKSGLFGVKDADQALSLMLMAQATGQHPALIMRDYDVIQGRLAKKAEAMLRDFQLSGGKVEWQELTDLRAAAIFSHPLSPKPISIDWDIPRAEKAGLTGKDGKMYVKYTRAMLRSRCISEGIRSTAPGATSQMYTPEELRQIAPELEEPISITQAVNDATAQVQNAIPEEELDGLIMTLDVKTLPELTTAFGHAYTRAKTAGDAHAMKKLKSVYDDMKGAIEQGQIV
jgi:hypothetical protein